MPLFHIEPYLKFKNEKKRNYHVDYIYQFGFVHHVEWH